VTAGGNPDCRVNPDINKSVSVQWVPPGCTGSSCTRFRVIIFAFNFDVIPDAVLYTCRFRIGPNAIGPYTLVNASVGASDPLGNILPVIGTNGILNADVTPRPTATFTPTPCTGDCDHGGSVTVDELVAGVQIALGQMPVSRCASFDRNEDQGVTVEELVEAVSNAISGCH